MPVSIVDGVNRAASAASDNALALGYLSGWRLVRLLPERTARRMFEMVADEVHRRDGGSVRRLRANLATIAPDADLDALTREAMRSYLRYFCESFRLPVWSADELRRRTHVVGYDWFKPLYDEGRGVVLPLPHMANWDWAGAWACTNGMSVVAVAERLKPERLYDEFVAYRRTLGMEILPLTGADAALPRLEAWVKGGAMACLLADRDLSRTAVQVDLCGAPARMPRGAAVLARRTGAPLVPVTLHYDSPETMVLTLHEPVPVSDDDSVTMQGVADAFSQALLAHPQDWHMMQRVFAS